MTHLHQEIATRVAAWRSGGYACPEFPAIAEVLEWAREGDAGALRYLRRPQVQALETYWCLRLAENTPHIAKLYRKLYPPGENLAALLEALGIPDAAFKAANYSIDRLWDRIKRKWECLNPDRLKYEMIFTSTATVTADQMREVRQFVEEAGI